MDMDCEFCEYRCNSDDGACHLVEVLMIKVILAKIVYIIVKNREN